MKSLRSFGRQEPRKLGNVLIIGCMFLSLCILSLIKAHYCTSPHVKLLVPWKANLKMVIDEGGDPSIQEDEDEIVNELVATHKPICYETSQRSDTCEAEGDIRIQGSSYTIFIHPSSAKEELKIKPYARKGDSVALAHVKEWSLKPLIDHEQLPHCTKNHSVPAVIFSIRGFTGNIFHDFTDVLIPLFISSHQFGGEVQFLVAEQKSWWVNKFTLILKQLSNYEIIDVGSDEEAVRCFPRVVIGPSFHKELGIDPSKSPNGRSMDDFKGLLGKAFALERESASAGDQESMRRPRLLIISRKKSRAFVNERVMVDMAMSLGYDVRVGEPDINTDISKFARLVNSADVMIGVHGAGLTNMVFLPVDAVVIQVIPLGGLEWLARDSFKQPAIDMKLKYLEYRIQEDESTLVEQYPKDHPVLKDPYSVHKQGWDSLKSVYLDKQNVRPHLGRLRNTLLEALKLLPQNN